MRAMISSICFGLMIAIPTLSLSQDKGKKGTDAAHVHKDIADHRAMADAHLNAAKCLESGKPEKECNAQLVKDCKGLAIGKYCGMKHRD